MVLSTYDAVWVFEKTRLGKIIEGRRRAKRAEDQIDGAATKRGDQLIVIAFLDGKPRMGMTLQQGLCRLGETPLWGELQHTQCHRAAGGALMISEFFQAG